MRRTLYLGKNELKNLTDKTIVLYSASGDIIKMPPCEYEQGEAYYIVSESNTHVDISRQVVVKNSGIGRNGVEVKTLFLVSDNRVRVMPTGE